MPNYRPITISTETGMYVLDADDWERIVAGESHEQSIKIKSVAAAFEKIEEPELRVNINGPKTFLIEFFNLLINALAKYNTHLSVDGEFAFIIFEENGLNIKAININTFMALSWRSGEDEMLVNSADWDFLVGDIDKYIHDVWTDDFSRAQVQGCDEISADIKTLDMKVEQIFRNKALY